MARERGGGGVQSTRRTMQLGVERSDANACIIMRLASWTCAGDGRLSGVALTTDQENNKRPLKMAVPVGWKTIRGGKCKQKVEIVPSGNSHGIRKSRGLQGCGTSAESPNCPHSRCCCSKIIITHLLHTYYTPSLASLMPVIWNRGPRLSRAASVAACGFLWRSCTGQ